MNREMLLNMARAGIAMNKAPTQDEIRTLVTNLSALPMFTGMLSIHDHEDIARQIEREFMVDLGPAHTLKGDHKAWLLGKRHEIQWNYWRRYKNHLLQSGFGPKVVDRLDEITDSILDLAGDPTDAGSWSRRGLVVGHVQSGKTANYVGLINKAADAGYKLVILIAGIHSNLRSQTQERIDEGFVGRDSDQLLGGKINPKFLGVGALDRSFSATAYTSRAYDFLRVRAEGLGVPINNLSQPAIFVIKKNKSILTNLIDWLQSTSSSGDRLTMPILVIDDEADNASVNTSQDPTKPNTINQLIRQLLNISTKNTYIGYTATPFANIFIDPDTSSEMSGDDLFPRDFIVGLDAPSTYVGANRFFLEQGSGESLTVEVNDTDDWLPLSHKIDTTIDKLHPSLVRAIDCFVLSKAIRILRGQGKRHHSMLVNVSRFTSVQSKIAERIAEHVKRLRDAVENRYAISGSEALRDPYIRSIHEAWAAMYRTTTAESWDRIQSALHQAAAGIAVAEVNARSGPGALDYRSHGEAGLTVIAVGGNSLSRGFTLEGLTISYFLRNTQMYDTLLQMGRWFGYRDGYADLCRLFIKTEALEWYSYIANATEELRDEIAKMESLKLTPLDFGFAVRSHPEALLVTARNKMRAAKEIIREVGLAAKLVESAVIFATDEVCTANLKATLVLGEKLQLAGISCEPFPPITTKTRRRPSRLFTDVQSNIIVDFIRSFVLHPANIEMSSALVEQYTERRALDKWDVVFVSKRSEEAVPFHIAGFEIGMQERNAKLDKRTLKISGNARRVASRGLERAGINDAQAAEAEVEFKKKNSGTNIADLYYRKVRTKPLLMVHILDVSITDDSATPREKKKQVHAAYGISFPGLADGEVESRIAYTANIVAYRELFGQFDVDGDDDDDATE
ncbi:Z1 domain-containing protein [Luteibacter rhizovicinus]|uniref:Z1 domain-containing protein n=1 Tax=Luteibacter rhizovicinus TaxID=242606 RepID=A0A4R3YHS1_9GAMM|nr:Z1 domain-containing protein [Luteibacter rhizovicinus]TCV91621.1 Z1 domain-containing protein [Luteibacter rhizovicinus]